MNQLQIGDQLVRYDRAATHAIYATIERGDADQCDCPPCKNYAAQRDTIFPPSVLALFDALGIDFRKEHEAIHYGGPLKNGDHAYGGWMLFAGELVNAGQRMTVPSDTPRRFEYFIGTSFPHSAVFPTDRTAAFDFFTELPWILPDAPDGA